MVRVTGEQLQKQSGWVRAQARREPVEVTYHGRPELVVLSVEDYDPLRQNRKLVMRREDMARETLARIAAVRMGAEHEALNALMDDD